MKTRNDGLALAAFFTTILSGFGQPTMPGILTPPTNQTAYLSSTATFSVTATGSPPLRYQWRFNNTDLVEKTNSSLKLLNVQFNEVGPYSVLVSNDGNSIMSSMAWLSVLPTNVVSVEGHEFRFGRLSAPIWEGARIDDQGPSVTGDGLTLFYGSKAPGGSGDLDLWMVKRPTLSSPWGTPVNLGPTINSSAADTDPTLSPGRTSALFSQQPIWRSRRVRSVGGDTAHCRRRVRSASEPWFGHQ